MMKKFVCLFVCLFVCSCDVLYGPIYISNVYFEDLYSKNKIADSVINYVENDNGYVEGKLKFLKENRKFIQAGGRKPFSEKYYITNLYLKPKGECFFLRYDIRELMKVKELAGFDPDSDDAVFLIERDGIRVVSREEYERLKPTFKPHPYDPSLCKPKPEN